MDYNYEFRRNRVLEPAQMLAANDIFHATIDQKYMLGCVLDLNDGRRFRYCENAAVILYKALMAQSSAPVANWLEQVQTTGTAAVVGDQTITIFVTTALVVGDLNDGWLLIQDVTAAALGDMYLIKEHTAGTLPVITIADTGGIRTATATDSDITVIKNKYKDVIVTPAAAATAAMVGVPLVDIPINRFFWAQTRGPCPLIVDTETVVVGDQIGETDDANVNGGCGIHAVTYPIYGTVMSKPTNTQTDQPAIVDLCLE